MFVVALTLCDWRLGLSWLVIRRFYSHAHPLCFFFLSSLFAGSHSEEIGRPECGKIVRCEGLCGERRERSLLRCAAFVFSCMTLHRCVVHECAFLRRSPSIVLLCYCEKRDEDLMACTVYSPALSFLSDASRLEGSIVQHMI